MLLVSFLLGIDINRFVNLAEGLIFLICQIIALLMATGIAAVNSSNNISEKLLFFAWALVLTLIIDFMIIFMSAGEMFLAALILLIIVVYFCCKLLYRMYKNNGS